MKAILPAMFFATLGIPVGTVCAVILAVLVFWVINDQSDDDAEDFE